MKLTNIWAYSIELEYQIHMRTECLIASKIQQVNCRVFANTPKPVLWKASTIYSCFQSLLILDLDQNYILIHTDFLPRVLSKHPYIQMVHSPMFHHYNHSHHQKDNRGQSKTHRQYVNYLKFENGYYEDYGTLIKI